uniref:Uncharacterized protein LOC111133236 n=1 Tax=Crassostrea virginica TaxID=6565 RepID=A0A8B8EBU1_CRAVI|nr:uncharacterized protein LOC111133236 [Crassostrea virginica]
MKLYYIVVIIFLYGQVKSAEKNRCDRKGKKICCSGYWWNKTEGICEECPPGYSGTDCEFMCYPPYYGARCLQTCHCPMDLCDAVSGCKITSTTNKLGNEKQPSTTAYRNKDISNEAKNERKPAVLTCIGRVCWNQHTHVVL